MKLSVIIPVFNEEKTILKIIDEVNNCGYKDLDIIIVDDCSNDSTVSKILQIDQKKYHSFIQHKNNLGKGAAIRSGLSAVKGDIVIIQDADLEYNPKEYINLIQPILDDKADVVYGSRFLSGMPKRVVYFWHRVGNGLLTLLSNMFTNLNLTDMETCYKAFRSSVILKINIEENRFGFEPEITAKISKFKIRIYEIGISYYGRTYDDGKKIGVKDGIRAIYCIIKYNLFR